jgi:hypothetical protein
MGLGLTPLFSGGASLLTTRAALTLPCRGRYALLDQKYARDSFTPDTGILLGR